MSHLISYSLGESAKQGTGWTHGVAADFATFVTNVLNVHRRTQKDGPAFVPGKLSDGARNTTAVDEISLYVVDIDKVQSVEHVTAILKGLDYNFYLYTSFNHLKNHTLFSWEKYRKWASAHSIVDLDADENILRATVEDGMEVSNATVRRDANGKALIAKDGKGVYFYIDHDPVHKFRIVLPLATPYVMSEFGANEFDLRAGHENWKKLYCFIGDSLGIKYDQVCSDPARIYYRPVTHTDESRRKEYTRIAQFKGKNIDWRDFKLPQNYKMPNVSKGIDLSAAHAVTNSSAELDVLFDGGHFRNSEKDNVRGKLLCNIIADTCSDLVVANKPDGGMRLVCPMDENHSKQGGDDAWLSPGEPGQNPVFSCSHTSCKGLKIPQFLSALTVQGKLTVEELHKRMRWSDEAVTKEYVLSERESKGSFINEVGTPKLTVAPMAAAAAKRNETAKALHTPNTAQPETSANFYTVVGPTSIITALAFTGLHKIDTMSFETLVEEVSKSQLPISEVVILARNTTTLKDKDLFLAHVKETRVKEFLRVAAEDIVVQKDLPRRQVLRTKFLQFFGCDESILQDAIENIQTERSNFPEAERILIEWTKKLFIHRSGVKYSLLEDYDELTELCATGLKARFGHLTVPRDDKESTLLNDLQGRLTTVGGIVSDASKASPIYKNNGKYYLNEYKAPKFCIEPMAGDASPFLYHLREVYAGGNEIIFKRLLLFFADIFQNPSFKKSSALVILGSQGTGKSILFDHGFRPILGDDWMWTSSSDKGVSGDFNLKRATALMCLFEEANMGGSRHKVANIFKQLISGTTEVAARKYENERTVQSIARYVLISNDSAPIDLDPDDRRYFVIRTSEKHKTDSKYHSKLRDWLAKGGAAIMLDYLLKFDPYEAGFEAGWGALYEPPPMTDAKSSMLTAAYTPLAMLAEALESPGQAGGDRAAIEEIKTNLKHWPALGDEMVSVPRQVYTDLRKAVVMSSDTHKTSKTDAMNKIDKLCTGAPSAKFVVKELKNGNVESWVSVFTQETIIRRLEKQNTINEDQAKYMLDYLRAMKG